MEYHISDRMKELKPSAIREIFKYAADPSVISLAAGDPAPESLPVAQMQKLMAEVLSDNPMQALLYSQSEGHPPFRAEIKKFLARRYHIGKDFDELIVTSGAQQCMDLITKVTCNEGDTVLCEEPSFIGSLNTFRSYGVNLVGIPMEADGIHLGKLAEALNQGKNIRFIYLIPNFQNPTGITMSLSKRRAVYDLAKRYNVLILEDNPYGDLRFEGEDIPSIKSMDEDGIVLYAGTFSKILSTGMRVGYLMAPQGLMGKIVVAKQTTDVHTNMLGQLLCYRFLTECDIDAHIEGLKVIYADKCGHMLAEIAANFPAEVSYTKPSGGLFVWATMPKGIDSNEFATKLVKERKVCVVPGTAFATKPGTPSSSIRMNFSMPSKENITIGVQKTAELMREWL
ncbi:MAG: PLP-dependent aminotransferase family protein [Oscillospiraceae bacterium]